MKVKEIVEVLPSSAKVSVCTGKKTKELLRRNVMELFEEAQQTHSIFREELNMDVEMVETISLKPLWYVVHVGTAVEA